MSKNRMAVVTAALTAMLLVGGIAWAASVPESGQVSLSSETIVSAGDAGDVVLGVGTALEVVAIRPADGWSGEVEVAAGREVEVDFRSGERRIQFNAELEDGEIRVRIRERFAGRDDVTDSTLAGATDSTASTTSTTSADAPTTVGSSSSTGEQVVVSAGDAGDVILEVGSQLRIVELRPEPGWSTEIEVAIGREVEADFRSGERRIQFNAEFEDGQVRVRVRDRLGDAETETETYLGSTPTTTAAGAPTGSEAYSVPGVATVGISWQDGRLTLASYVLVSGWTAEIEEQSSTKIRIDFENGDRDARFEARLDGAVVDVEIDGD